MELKLPKWIRDGGFEEPDDWMEPPDRGDMLADTEVEPFHKGRVDVPTQGGEHVIDGLQGAKHHTVMHVDQPPVERRKPPAVERACTALKIIEDLREAHVRGNQPIADGAAGQWERAYAQCVAELSAALGISVAAAR